MSEPQNQPTPPKDRRYLGAVWITILLSGLAVHDQITSGSVEIVS